MKMKDPETASRARGRKAQYRRVRLGSVVALRRIRAEIELLEATQGSYFEIVMNVKGILEQAGLKVLPSPAAAGQLTHDKLRPLTHEDRERRQTILSKRGPRS